MTIWSPPSGIGNPTHNEWMNGANLYASDNAYATASIINTREDTDGYSWSLLAGSGQYIVLDQIYGEIEAKTTKLSGLGRCTLGLSLSWDGGVSWTGEYRANWAFVEGEVTKQVAVLYGTDRKNWGRYWTIDELDSGVFRCRLRVARIDATTTAWVDRVRIGVDIHQAAHVGAMGVITDDTEIVVAF